MTARGAVRWSGSSTGERRFIGLCASTAYSSSPRDTPVLRQKIQRSGLTVRRITSVGLFMLPAAVLKRLLQSPSEAHSDVELPRPAINRLFMGLLWLEAVWLRCSDLPAGLSLLALAQESLSDPVALRDAKALMRAALARHLGDRPLHSRKLFRRVVPLVAVET